MPWQFTHLGNCLDRTMHDYFRSRILLFHLGYLRNIDLLVWKSGVKMKIQVFIISFKPDPPHKINTTGDQH